MIITILIVHVIIKSPPTIKFLYAGFAAFQKKTIECYTDILILACLTQVVDFNIHVTESGEEYNETIEVDTQKQTEVFKVPAHPGVDRSDVMHDMT